MCARSGTSPRRSAQRRSGEMHNKMDCFHKILYEKCCESWMLILDPVALFYVPGPRSNNKKGVGEIVSVFTFFVATNFTKLKKKIVHVYRKDLNN
jgi:hypothetical protein